MIAGIDCRRGVNNTSVLNIPYRQANLHRKLPVSEVNAEFDDEFRIFICSKFL